MGEGSCRVVGWGEDEKREGKGGKKGRSERKKGNQRVAKFVVPC